MSRGFKAQAPNKFDGNLHVSGSLSNLSHFSHNFQAKDFRWKGKALATKYVFQNYSQVLDIWTGLDVKTDDEFFGLSVYIQPNILSGQCIHMQFDANTMEHLNTKSVMSHSLVCVIRILCYLTYCIQSKCQGLENQFCIIRVSALTDSVSLLASFHCTSLLHISALTCRTGWWS